MTLHYTLIIFAYRFIYAFFCYFDDFVCFQTFSYISIINEKELLYALRVYSWQRNTLKAAGKKAPGPMR